jgi:hypothetical protein
MKIKSARSFITAVSIEICAPKKTPSRTKKRGHKKAMLYFPSTGQKPRPFRPLKRTGSRIEENAKRDEALFQTGLKTGLKQIFQKQPTGCPLAHVPQDRLGFA